LVLEVEGLRVRYGTHEVLHGVSLSAVHGEMVGIFGHNGAGKSTLLKAIFGLLPATSGRVTFDGEDKTRWKPSRSSRSGMGFALQEGNIFPNLTVLENLRLAGTSVADERTTAVRMDDIFRLFPVLLERAGTLTCLLSGGQRQMVAVGLALMTKPKLILLDEPSFGLAPLVVKNLFDVIREINAGWGSTVILVEQNVKESLRLVSRTYVMTGGSFVYEGPSKDEEEIVKAIWGVQQPAAGARALDSRSPAQM
jgi:branched-chain amino acid transport system ATP-binding protein